jgi:hypothetical protein
MDEPYSIHLSGVVHSSTTTDQIGMQLKTIQNVIHLYVTTWETAMWHQR